MEEALQILIDGVTIEQEIGSACLDFSRDNWARAATPRVARPSTRALARHGRGHQLLYAPSSSFRGQVGFGYNIARLVKTLVGVEDFAELRMVEATPQFPLKMVEVQAA